jgi:hypothetical protein
MLRTIVFLDFEHTVACYIFSFTIQFSSRTLDSTALIGLNAELIYNLYDYHINRGLLFSSEWLISLIYGCC